MGWMVWTRRNKLRTRESALQAQKIPEAARLFLAEFQQKFTRLGDRPTRARVKWKPPDDASFKTNFDGQYLLRQMKPTLG